jgi:probable DNA repair protein
MRFIAGVRRVNLHARCINHLEAGGWLLTQNLRQARILRRLHDRAQIEAGRQVWPSAGVMPLDAWLGIQWQEAAAAQPQLPGLLRPAAAEWLWRQRAARDAPGLIDAADLGARARASWICLRSHGGTVESLARWPLTRDQQAFVTWGLTVEREFEERGLRDPADLPRLLIESAALPPPGAPLLLAGVRRWTPAQFALIEALRARGWSVEIDVPLAVDGRTWRHAAADPDAEQATLLSWMRQQFANRPDGVHGLILPDLVARRGAIERALASALQPELELPDGVARERVFDLAGGSPLASQPVVASALCALECARGRVDWATVSRLLRSRHVAGALTERTARVQLDVDLRCAQPQMRWPIAVLAARAGRAAALDFATALNASAAAIRGPARRSAGAWAEAFGLCLAAWDWPGGSELDSNEFQAARALRERLLDLSRLDPVAPAFSLHEALHELHRSVGEPFQPERGEPAIYVMDTLDDPGIQFDSLWVAGLTAAAWPRPASVDPLLPIEVQRRIGVPGVTAEDSVADARAVIERWQLQSAELVLSWPRRENDSEVDGSPLIPATARELTPPAPLRSREQLILASAVLEPLTADAAPPRRPGPARGGARLLELQSQCPFRAFAELRLGATRLEEPQAGIDRRTRGIVLHRALQQFWSAIRSQAELARLDAGSCQQRVVADVDAALAQVLPPGTSARSLALERDWQLRAIAGFLTLERTRPDFIVAEAERSIEGELGGLALQLQADRVDRVGESLVVIDYKTGKVTPSQWRGARMDAPQLPLYAVLHGGPPAGIAVAALSAESAAYQGVASDAGFIDGLVGAEDFRLTETRERGFGWQQIVRHWRAWLDALARDHAAGRAEVDPKRAAATCRNCHLGALCRVAATAPDEIDIQQAGDED